MIPVARPELGAEEVDAVAEVIDSGWVTQGPKVAEFERAFARSTGARAAIAVSSCTSALHLSLLAAGVGPGDEVILPSMSFIATANAVVHAGATPIFAEVDPATYNLDLDDASSRIGPKTRAVLLVHQLGLPADIDEFVDLASSNNLALIEDAACAVGSTYKGKQIGGHGNLCCFSFHPRKLITTGDGGMITTSSEAEEELIRRLRHHGMSVSDADRHSSSKVELEQYLEVGYNYRLTDIQAAVGLVQLGRLPGIVANRQIRARWYDELFESIEWAATPPTFDDRTWNVQTYTVRLAGVDAERRNELMQFMLDKGIATRPGVMTAHRQPAYQHLGVSLPISERASDGSLVLPLFGGLTEADSQRVVETLADAWAS